MGRVLVVEKHAIETSGSMHQLQIPRQAFVSFFAGRNSMLSAQIFNPPTALVASPRGATIRAYTNSTNRVNGITDLGSVGHALVFIEEDVIAAGFQYFVWWYPDPLANQIIANWRGNWKHANRSQHGLGRRWTIVASVPSRDHAKWGNAVITHIPQKP